MSKAGKISLDSIIIYLMAVFVMSLPRRISVGGMYSYHFVIIAAFLLMLVARRGKIYLGLKAIGLITILFFAATFIRSFFANQLVFGIGYVLDSVILFLLFINIIREQRSLDIFLKVFIFCMAVYSVLGIFEFFTGFNLWNAVSGAELSTIRYGMYRSYGVCTNFTNNAMFLFLSLPLIFWKITESKGKSRSLYIASYILVLCNILTTLTRMAILCTLLFHIVLLFKYGLLEYIKKYFLQLVFAGLIVLILVCFIPSITDKLKMITDMFVAVLDEDVANEISGTFGGNANGVGHRVLLYSWIWETIQGHTVFGLGPNKLFEYHYVTDMGNHMIKTSIENQYLITLYRFGIVGLVLYLLMCVRMVLRMYSVRKTEKRLLQKNRRRPTPMFLMITAIVIYMLSGLSFAYADDFRMLFICLGIIYVYNNSMLAAARNNGM